jgi:acetyl esterase/lipase
MIKYLITRQGLTFLVFALGTVSFFLSLWIVIPAPIDPLLILGVGAPEISPWLIIFNFIPLGIATFQVLISAKLGLYYSLWQRLTLGISLVGLILSCLPLLQLPATQQKMAAAMVEGLGADYLANIPNEVRQNMRGHPFVFADALRGINTGEVRYTPNIQFATPDGVALSMDVYRPPKVGNYPAIVILYGGAWQYGNPKANADFSRYMAARGYTIFAIDYRHAPRYRFPAQLEDVRAALNFIRQSAAKYEAQADRMAILGRSAGGHLAMLAAYEPDALPIRAVVSYYGPFNLTEGYKDPPNPDPLNVRALLSAFLGGTPEQLPETYIKASPASYVRQSLPPTLLIHGSRDHIVEVRFARDMYKRLRAVGNNGVLLEIPWAEHAFDAIFNGPSNQLALYYTERFLAWALK